MPLRLYIGAPVLALVAAAFAVMAGCGQGDETLLPADSAVPSAAASTTADRTSSPAAPVAAVAAPAPTVNPLPAAARAPVQTPPSVDSARAPVQTPPSVDLTRTPELTATRPPANTPTPTRTPEPAATRTPVEKPSPTVVPDPTEVAVEPSPTRPPAPSPTETPAVVEGQGGGGVGGAAVVALDTPVELPTTEVVKILTPSVVDITTEFAGPSTFSSPAPAGGIGTGVVLDLEGHILTSSHVVEGAERVDVTMHDGRSYLAEAVVLDRVTDLAVVKITAEGLRPAMLGDSSELLVGEDVVAIGHALGLSGGPTVSKGVVSALGRSIDTTLRTALVDLIQTDASINPGNSGGPLVNSRAEVIGINTAVSGAGQGIGFATNINDAKVVARQLIDQGFVLRGYLGVVPASLTPALAFRIGLEADTEGIVLRGVVADTPAADAGLQPGDIIVMMGGRTLRNTGELSKFLIAHQPGETVDYTLIRDGEETTGQLTLGSRPEG